jgi:anti-anti-sigma factor
MTPPRHCATGTNVAPASVGAHDLQPQRTPASSTRRIEVRTLPDAAIVTVRGDVDIDLADALRAALAEAIAHRRRVVLNVTEVAVIDSIGLGVLVRAHRDARRLGGALCLVAGSRFIVTVLHATRLDAMFALFDDCEHALAWLARPSSSW